MIGDNKLQKLQLMCHEMEKYNKNISKITQNTTLQKNKQRLQNIKYME